MAIDSSLLEPPQVEARESNAARSAVAPIELGNNKPQMDRGGRSSGVVKARERFGEPANRGDLLQFPKAEFRTRFENQCREYLASAEVAGGLSLRRRAAYGIVFTVATDAYGAPYE
jgi:hypothetical protein